MVCAGGEKLHYRGHLDNVSDAAALELVTMLSAQGEVALGLDAPLSYQDGGGFRPGDHLLKQALSAIKAHHVGVMSPTMYGMMALTLRGIALVRMFARCPTPPAMVEVHPGAAMALRGAKLDLLRVYKTPPARRERRARGAPHLALPPRPAPPPRSLPLLPPHRRLRRRPRHLALDPRPPGLDSSRRAAPSSV